jgi:hypothetical protein
MKVKVVIHEAEEGGYWAEVPAIPGCATQGETFEELLKNFYEASISSSRQISQKTRFDHSRAKGGGAPPRTFSANRREEPPWNRALKLKILNHRSAAAPPCLGVVRRAPKGRPNPTRKDRETYSPSIIPSNRALLVAFM